MIAELAVCTLILSIVYQLLLYKKLHYHFQKWGIKYKPGVPIFGNTFYSTFLLKHVAEDIQAVYRAFPEERYVGFMEGMNPIILVRDPDLMKLITVKNFDHFVNRNFTISKEFNPLLGSSVFSMKGDKWRKMRPRLTTLFSGTKMRAMVPLMIKNSNDIVKYLKDRSAEDIYVLDLMHRFNTDVVASAGFGVEVNSFIDRNNVFYTSAKAALKFTILTKLYLFLMSQCPVMPKMMKFLGIKSLPSKHIQFFRDIVVDTLAHRKKSNDMKPNFIYHLMPCVEDWTLDELVGQIYFTLLTSFESSSDILTMCIHELALRPDCEDRLYQEIKTAHEKYGEFKYDCISELKYLDCVLQESTRKWTPALVSDRVCSQTYVMPPPREGGRTYVLKPGDVVYNVLNSIHMDSQHHHMPNVFNPDRFSNDKQDIKSFTFMPFGMGPRSCPGMRFSIMEMKICLYHLILNFRILPCKKTVDYIHLEPHEFSFKATGGSYVRFEPRV